MHHQVPLPVCVCVCVCVCARVCARRMSMHAKLILLKYSLGLESTGSLNQLLTLSSFIRRV